MANDRVLVVHESSGTRALFSELLIGEGFRVEAVANSIRCISRFLDEPAEIVILGLVGLAQSELDLITTLKREAEPPRVIVCFPSPKRDLAVRALQAGADAYLLEPFYANEMLAVVRGQRPANPRAGAPADLLSRFAGEVAHAINNPLQVIMLLLDKERVTKKELIDLLPRNLERIRHAVELLKAYGGLSVRTPRAGDPALVARRVAAEHQIELRVGGGAVRALFDETAYGHALASLFDATQPRSATVAAEGDCVALRVPGDAGDRLDQVLVVTPEREIRPGLLLARTLLERQGGSLTAEGGEIVARVPTVR